MKYKSVNKPAKCPECGSEKVALILYGLPVFSDDLRKRIRNNEIDLGGCCVSKNDPSWKCVDCKTAIYRMEIDLESSVN